MNPRIHRRVGYAFVLSVGNIIQIRVTWGLLGETLNAQIPISWGHWLPDSANNMRASGRFLACPFRFEVSLFGPPRYEACS